MTRLPRAFALSALLLVAAACGSEADDPAAAEAPTATEAAAATEAPAVTEAPAATEEPAATEAPATTETAAGSVPERIVSLSPTATEMVFAIGAGGLVVAVDDMSNFPEEALAVQTDLSGYTPNVEAIAAYEPDLVLVDGSMPDLQPQLEALGIGVWAGPAAVTFDDTYQQIEQLGVATGHVAEAAELVAQIQADIEAAVASVPALSEPPSYYHELDPTFYSVTSATFIGEVYGLFGLRNIADATEADTLYPQLSPEFIISQDPDLVFLADTKCCGETPESVAARDGWAEISAIATGTVIALDDDIASRWGPRVVDFVEAIAAAVQQVATISAG